MGTHWEPGKDAKKSFLPLPPPPPQTYGKKSSHLESMIGPSHWLHQFLFPKEFVTIFGLG
jgi:hypothetical protein